MDETATGTLASPSSLHAPPSTLPFRLITEILCRLPVKLLIQLKCVCKSWKTLISDPKFTKKHLRVSNTYHHHHHIIVTGRDSLLWEDSLLWDSTMSSVFSDASTTSAIPQLRLIRPAAISGSCVSSCDGILLFSTGQRLPLLWNPSIRKFKILPLPPSLNPGPVDFAASDEDEYTSDYDDFIDSVEVEYTFGYDHFIDNYKVFAVTFGDCNIEVSVYTLGADSWRSIDDFPNRGPIRGPGMFVSGSVNWLALDRLSHSLVIVSLDLEKESYRKLLMPDLEKDHPTSLGVLRDCLCLFVNNVHFFDVWVMKEYGIEESWTKLFSIPYVRGHGSYVYTKVVYVYEDDQVLLDFKESPQSDLKLVVYNSRNCTFKIPKVEKINDLMYPEVYVESLISPCT